MPSEEDDATESIRRRRRRDSRASRFFVESAKSETARKRETRGARVRRRRDDATAGKSTHDVDPPSPKHGRFRRVCTFSLHFFPYECSLCSKRKTLATNGFLPRVVLIHITTYAAIGVESRRVVRVSSDTQKAHFTPRPRPSPRTPAAWTRRLCPGTKSARRRRTARRAGDTPRPRAPGAPSPPFRRRSPPPPRGRRCL